MSLAAERGDIDVMKALIERGADVNTQNKVIMYCNEVHCMYEWANHFGLRWVGRVDMSQEILNHHSQLSRLST